MKSKIILYIAAVTTGFILVFIPLNNESIYVPYNCSASANCLTVTGGNQDFTIRGFPLKTNEVDINSYNSELIPLNMFINFSIGFMIPISIYYGFKKVKGNK